jgi:hypothetical protein
MNQQLQAPVVFIVFNRPAHTRASFARIAEARPSRLLVIADGPRANKPGEFEDCEEVRMIVTAVDWPCQVEVNFSSENMGCRDRIISGLDWAFSLVEEAIILEDDCLPDPSFFPFCQEMLERYRGDARVASVCGTNLIAKYLNIEASYFFSQLGGIWGWATWRSEWQGYDRYLEKWPQFKRDGGLSEIFEEPKAVEYWTRIFDDMYRNKGPNTWDYQWLYTRLKNNALTIVPRVNLVANIGFREGATHTVTADPRLAPPVVAIEFPLKHPISFIPLRSMDRRIQDLFMVPFSQRISGKIRRVTRGLWRRP